MSFANLRQSRQARQTSLAQTQSKRADTTAETLDGPAPEAEESKEWTQRGSFYEDLSKQLEIRIRQGAGRGVYVASSLANGTEIKSGSVVLSVVPHASALSTRCLSSYCSFCHIADSAPLSTSGQPSEFVKLKRCTMCKVIWYCSNECQNTDWAGHKSECAALRRWASSSQAAASQEHDPSEDNEDALKSTPIPNEAIRVLGRILWNMEANGLNSPWTQEIHQMKSHRTSLPLKSPAHATLTALAHALARYLSKSSGANVFEKWGINTAPELVDLLSRFTTNSFTLTTPSLSPIGVSVSPVTALINHSCVPNAVVVFPRRTKSLHQANRMEVIAIRDIKPGEEILTSYVDISLPSDFRRRELKQSHMFDCMCPACTSIEPDMRNSLVCPQCASLITIPEDPGNAQQEQESEPRRLICLKCQETVTPDIDALLDALRLAGEGLVKASALQFDDPPRALTLTRGLISLLHPYALHHASHPLLALTRLHQSLLIVDLSTLPEPTSPEENIAREDKIDETCRIAARNVGGVCAIFAEGHPVRGVALAELGKLLCVDVGPTIAASTTQSEGNIEGEGPLPRGTARLELAFQVLLRARSELDTAFGAGGGEVGREVKAMMDGLEREVNVWRKANAGGTAGKTAGTGQMSIENVHLA